MKPRYFNSVSEALVIARELQTKGFLFRGQSNAEWFVTSTAERLSNEGVAEAHDTVERLKQWARQIPQLKDFPLDSLIAIAQHYGIPTFFIDFTDDPEVAAFFACNSGGTPKPDQRAAIVYFDPIRFNEFWSNEGAKLLANTPGAEAPEIIRIDVQNLWRLQTQRGCFLWNPLAHIERLYKEFGRLTFSCRQDDPSLLPEERIYPRNESALEQLLKGFFMNEQIRRGNALIESAGFIIERVGNKGFDATSWWPNGIQPTADWAEALKWESLPNERAETTLVSPPLPLRWSETIRSIGDQILATLTTPFISNNRHAGLFFSETGAVDPIVDRLKACTRRLWNGMRILPYDAEEIREALEATIQAFLSARRTPDGAALQLSDLPSGKFRQRVQFTKNPEGSGDYSQGFVSNENLIGAHSSAFLQAALTYLGNSTPEAFTLLRLPARPWQRFSFAALRRLMVQELIPTQLVLRGEDPTTNALNRMIYFSPADLKIFGLA